MEQQQETSHNDKLPPIIEIKNDLSEMNDLTFNKGKKSQATAYTG